MPLAVEPTVHRTNGVRSKVEIPFSQFVGVAFEQGVNDSALASIQRMTELDILNDGPLLQPKEANERYGLQDILTFDAPVHEPVAQAIRARKDRELYRQFVLENGSPGLISPRGLAGFGAMMLGNISNPLDMALNLVPIVGPGKTAVSLGRAAARTGSIFTRGLIPRSALRKVTPFHRTAEAVAEGSIGASLTEIPLFISNSMDKADYGLHDATLNVAFGGAFNAAIYAGLRGAARILDNLTVRTKQHLEKQALEQLMNDRNIDLADEVKLDPGVIREDVRTRNRSERAATLKSADPEQVRQTVLNMFKGRKTRLIPVLDFGDDVKATESFHLLNTTRDSSFKFSVTKKVKGQKGDVVTYEGKAGQTIAEARAAAKTQSLLGKTAFLQTDVDGAVGGYKVVDEKGKTVRTITESQLAETLGLDEPYIPRDLISDKRVKALIKSDPDANRRYLEAKQAGASEDQALEAVRDVIRRRDQDTFFERPEVKKAIKEETERRTAAYVQKKQARYKNNVDVEEQQMQFTEIERGKTITEKEQKDFTVDPEIGRIVEAAKEQTAELEDWAKRMAEVDQESKGALSRELQDLAAKQPEEAKDIIKGVQAGIDCMLNAGR